MVKVNKLMLACVVYIKGGHLWLQYIEYNKNVDIGFHT